MAPLLALTTVLSVSAFFVVWLCTTLLANIVLVWAVFICWGTYFANGANMESVKLSLGALVLGIVLAHIAVIAIVNIPVGTVTAAVWVAVFVGIFTYASRVKLLSALPTTVNAFALIFAYVLQTPGKLSMDVLTALDFTNPMLKMIASAIFGVAVGVATNYLTGILSSGGAKAAAE